MFKCVQRFFNENGTNYAPCTHTLVVYSSIPETMNVDHTQLLEEGYYAAPRAVDKVCSAAHHLFVGIICGTMLSFMDKMTD